MRALHVPDPGAVLHREQPAGGTRVLSRGLDFAAMFERPADDAFFAIASQLEMAEHLENPTRPSIERRHTGGTISGGANAVE
jgi:hypothetical protein